jgi:PAS domain S-box-containing protein
MASLSEKKDSPLSSKTENPRFLNPNELLAIFNAIPYGIMIMDADKKIRLANNKALEMLKFNSQEELFMTPCRDVICHMDEDNCPIRDRGKLTDHSECILLDKDKKEIPVQKSAIPFMFNGEEVVLETIIDISQHKNVEQNLFESRRILTTLLGNLPGFVFRCLNDENWTMEFISDAFIGLTGYQPDDIIGNKKLCFNDIIIEEDRKRIWDEVQQKIFTQKPYTLEYRIRTADGKIKWVWEQTKGIFSPEEKLIFAEGYITDISEEKRLETIKQSIFDISTAAYTSRSLDEFFRSIHQSLGKMMDVSNFFVAMYDKKTDSISLPYEVDTKDQHTSFPAGKTCTGYVIRTRKPLLADENGIRKLVQEGEIEIVGSPSKVWLGVPMIVGEEVIGVMVVQSYDDPNQFSENELELLKFVADQIGILIARKKAEESFQEEKAYLEQLFEGSPEAIVMIDGQGTINMINSGFTSLFGYSREEAYGKNIDDLLTTDDLYQEGLEITNKTGMGQVAELETRRKHKLGNLIDVSILVTPIRISGRITGGYGIYRDITDRKRIEKSLITAKEKAEESDKLKSAFLSNMSHEIRTPMNAILGFSTLLSDTSLSEGEKSEYVQIIKERGNDLLRIIDDIIDVAKIESGQIKIEIKECFVNELLTNLHITLNEVKRKQAKNKIILNFLPGSTDMKFSILTDPNRLRQVMTNLVENALKFTEEGFVEFGYDIKSDPVSPQIEFFVRDTGIGIPREMHGVIFERFRQVDDTNTRKYGGTGLGLTISKNLVKLLGGDIRIDSDRGQGTRFYITLPLSQASVAREAKSHDKAEASPEINWKDRVVLVVEDEDSNYFLIDRMLRKTGITLLWARNGKEAIEVVSSRKIDAILMDIRMPVMDGYEATLEIKKIKREIPVIAQTAYALKGEREKSLAAGCDAYISKPIDAQELRATLTTYLR